MSLQAFKFLGNVDPAGVRPSTGIMGHGPNGNKVAHAGDVVILGPDRAKGSAAKLEPVNALKHAKSLGYKGRSKDEAYTFILANPKGIAPDSEPDTSVADSDEPTAPSGQDA